MELKGITEDSVKVYAKKLYEQCKPSQFWNDFIKQSILKEDTEILKNFINMQPEEFIKTVIALHRDNKRLREQVEVQRHDLENFEKIKDIMAEYHRED